MHPNPKIFIEVLSQYPDALIKLQNATKKLASEMESLTDRVSEFLKNAPPYFYYPKRKSIKRSLKIRKK